MPSNHRVRKDFTLAPEVVAVLDKEDNMSAFVEDAVRRRHIQQQSKRLIIEIAQTALDSGYTGCNMTAFWRAAENYTGYRGIERPEWLTNLGVGFTGPPFAGEQPRVESGSVEMPSEQIRQVTVGTTDCIGEMEQRVIQDIRETVRDRYFEDTKGEIRK